MKVKDLIKELQGINPEAEIFTPGYKGPRECIETINPGATIEYSEKHPNVIFSKDFDDEDWGVKKKKAQSVLIS